MEAFQSVPDHVLVGTTVWKIITEFAVPALVAAVAAMITLFWRRVVKEYSDIRQDVRADKTSTDKRLDRLLEMMHARHDDVQEQLALIQRELARLDGKMDTAQTVCALRHSVPFPRQIDDPDSPGI